MGGVGLAAISIATVLYTALYLIKLINSIVTFDKLKESEGSMAIALAFDLLGVVIAIMAIHRLGIHVKGQGDITIRTGIYLTTLPTHHKAGITPPI